ncbi:hypothetical protein BN1221_00112 [Brenneria goodwinii]|uniref:K+-transporting ATPase, F subunit n=2 Tax=Brenneria goodwinii TaxID=1109412 RepID=A0A0G4JP71_9GAMM|nr:hypothetical protein BN1221_00112 [Brenneria goodwinii]
MPLPTAPSLPVYCRRRAIFILFLRPTTGNLHLLFPPFSSLLPLILDYTRRGFMTLGILLGSLLVLLLLSYLVYALLKAENF